MTKRLDPYQLLHGPYPAPPLRRADRATCLIPDRSLQKVLRELERQGIVWAIRGPGRGYQLAKAPKDITLLEIIEAVDGPIRSQGEFDGIAGNTLGKKLPAAWDQVDVEICRQLGKVRLSDLAGKA
jgi:Rrf2 family protein